MAVVPVRAVLPDLESVRERLARRDAREVHARHAVVLERHDEAVPVDRRGLVHRVSHAQNDVVALAQVDQRPRHGAVERHRVARDAADRHGRASDLDVPLALRFGARDVEGSGGRRARRGFGVGAGPARQQARAGSAAREQRLGESAAHRIGKVGAAAARRVSLFHESNDSSWKPEGNDRRCWACPSLEGQPTDAHERAPSVKTSTGGRPRGREPCSQLSFPARPVHVRAPCSLPHSMR